MEAVFAFIMGVMFNWWFFVPVALAALFFDKNESTLGAVFWGALAFVALLGIFGLPWSVILWGVLAYIPVGFVYSFWAWYRFSTNKVKNWKALSKRGAGTNYVTEAKRAMRELEDGKMPEEIDYKKRVDLIVYWIFFWPINLASMIAGDLITMVESLIKNVFNGVYSRISRAIMNKVQSEIKEKDDTSSQEN